MNIFLCCFVFLYVMLSASYFSVCTNFYVNAVSVYVFIHDLCACTDVHVLMFFYVHDPYHSTFCKCSDNVIFSFSFCLLLLS